MCTSCARHCNVLFLRIFTRCDNEDGFGAGGDPCQKCPLQNGFRGSQCFSKAISVRCHSTTTSCVQQPKQVACRQKVLYVPTEALPAALDELPQLVAFRNAHTPSSPHYVQTMSSNGVPMRQGAYGDTASWSWSRVKAAMDGHSLPPYESFFANQSLLQYALGCLYRPDVELYQAMCEQPELQGCVSCRRACTAFMQSMSQLSNRDHT